MRELLGFPAQVAPVEEENEMDRELRKLATSNTIKAEKAEKKEEWDLTEEEWAILPKDVARK